MYETFDMTQPGTEEMDSLTLGWCFTTRLPSNGNIIQCSMNSSSFMPVEMLILIDIIATAASIQETHNVSFVCFFVSY